MNRTALAPLACIFLLASCAPTDGGKPTATAATAGEEAPLLETLKARAADQDLAWEEWAPVGVAAARLDWPCGAAYAGGSLYLVGTRAVKTAAATPRKTEIAFVRLAPSGAEEVAAYPSPFGERAGAAVAASRDGRVWFVGGMYTPPPINLVPEGRLDFAELGTPAGEVFTWRPRTRGFELAAYLPVPRGDAAALFHGEELYVVGGTFDPASPDADNNRQAHRYDVAVGLWTKLHDLPVPLARPAAAVADGGLFVVGGKQLKPAHITNAVFRYDLAAYKWRKTAPLPAPRVGASAYAVGDYIYVVGGCEAEGFDAPPRMALKSYRYDLKQKRWEELASPLPEGCTLTAFDGDYFYLVGAEKTYRGRLVKAEP